MNPDQTAPMGSSLIRVHSVCFHDIILSEVLLNVYNRNITFHFQDKKRVNGQL